ncbi:MAG: hypothetical protein OJI67_11370 [Prosthecobacter sp.]|nr:hypothetical protein [Prosthecobacter sp.]
MKTSFVLCAVLPMALLTSCYVTPAGGPYGAYAPPPPRVGGTVVVTETRPAYGHGRYRHPRSPLSPGGVVVLPREARRVVYRGGTYYTHRNVWYRSSGSGYVVCARPY